jgi:signal transduction histidine kinase/tetratricopeptide (TPR) repeat protein
MYFITKENKISLPKQAYKVCNDYVMKLLLFCFFTLLPTICFAQRKQADSLKNILVKMEKQKNYQTDTIYLETYQKYAFSYYFIDADSMLLIATKSKDLAEKAKQNKWIARAYINVGHSYYMKGIYNIALDNYLKGLKIAEKYNYQKIMSNAYNNIANIHNLQNNHKEAIKTYQKSLEISTKINDLPGIATAFNNIANTYHNLNDYEKSLEYDFKSLEISQKIKDKQGIAFSYNNIGFNYIKKNEIEKGNDYLEKSLKICEEIGEKDLETEVLMGMAKVQMKKKNFQTALQLAHKSLQITLTIKNKDNLKRLYKMLSEIYENIGEYQKGLQYYKLHKVYYDSLDNIENKNQIAQLQAKYEFEKKEAVLKTEQQKKDLKNEKDIFKQKTYILALSALIIITTLIIILLIKNQVKTKKDNEIISKQKIDIENQNVKLEAQAERLKELNALKDKLFSIIGHDLRSPLNQLKGVLNILESGFLNEQEFKKILPNLSQNVTSASNLLDNLLYWAESQMNGEAKKASVFDLNQVIKNNIELFSRQATQKSIIVTNHIDSKLMIFADKDMLDLVIRNLLNNAIKFCNQNDKIDFSYKKFDTFIEICIQDTGVGIEPKRIKKLFGEGHKSERGTAGEKGTGLGLTLCKDFVEKNGGKIWVESELNKGSKFYFTAVAAAT